VKCSFPVKIISWFSIDFTLIYFVYLILKWMIDFYEEIALFYYEQCEKVGYNILF